MFCIDCKNEQSRTLLSPSMQLQDRSWFKFIIVPTIELNINEWITFLKMDARGIECGWKLNRTVIKTSYLQIIETHGILWNHDNKDSPVIPSIKSYSKETDHFTTRWCAQTGPIPLHGDDCRTICITAMTASKKRNVAHTHGISFGDSIQNQHHHQFDLSNRCRFLFTL